MVRAHAHTSKPFTDTEPRLSRIMSQNLKRKAHQSYWLSRDQDEGAKASPPPPPLSTARPWDMYMHKCLEDLCRGMSLRR